MFNPNRKQKIESSSFGNSASETVTDDLANKQETKSEKPQIFKNEKKTRTDPVQILLTATIFIFLAGMIYFILGPISMVAMGLGGGLSVYHMLSAKRKMFSKHQGRRGPSVFLLVLILSPFLMGGLVAYEGATLLESPTRIILLWAMTISFWTTMLFVPMSVLSKKRENLQPELKKYPRVSVIIPAYNEEKVIKKTLESMIETHYPRKEIIFVDDGSTDNTLEIARQFKNQITVLKKDNGGKASALNYALVYAKGEIIVVVDADTIIGRNSLREIVKGFEIDEDVAAVAGNIKVRNRVNWITKCQALEYLIGIQVIRRAFDAFGSITVVPGALGAFKKSFVSDTGAYEKETIVEDFDQTIKLLKAGL
ncbi:MAG: glycosyltransferase family 2 protein, partial [Nitrosopumilus sp.]|nr:glycosyltransferase family 2 protein [Nitrosopumilus sp.]